VPVPRTAIALLAASLAIAAPLAAGGRDGSPAGTRAPAVSGAITLRAHFHQGAWKKSLSIRLVKLRLIDFTICAIWNYSPTDAFDCRLASKGALPAGTSLRLEQSPIAKAVRRADSPGWGMLGASPDAALGAVVSNLVTGNKRGTFHYRVTLRDKENKVLVTSNVFTVVWR
jgi:hypothetical protein